MSLLSSIGSFLGGAGQLLGGLGVGKDKPPPVMPPAEQSHHVREHERLQFQDKMALAKEHGLHPLSVLGVPVGSSFSPVISSGAVDTGPDFASIGYGAGQIAKSFVQPPAPVEDRHHPDPLEDRLKLANVRYAEARAGQAETAYMNEQLSQMALLGQPGRPPGVVRSNDTNALQSQVALESGIPMSYVGAQNAPVQIEQKVLPPHPNLRGVAAGADQAMLRVVDPKGGHGTVVNSQAINADLEKGATFTALAKVYGVDQAMAITAALENEGLLIGGAVAAGYGIKNLYNYIKGRASGKPSPRYRAKHRSPMERR